MLVSIAIPCYKSARTLPMVVADIQLVFSESPKYDYEIILVNDGSPDNTFDVIHSICQDCPNVYGISLSKNFGQQAAKSAAIPYVNGNVLIFMDDDGQHPASGVIPMIDKIQEGYDIVYANFMHKKHSMFKRITSKIHNWLLVKAGSKSKEINLSSFTAFSTFSIQALKNSKSPVVATGAYLRKLTNQIGNVSLEHQYRTAGKSNYTLKRLFATWINAITSFNVVSLRIATIAGIICGLLGILCAVFILIQRILNPQMQAGFASIMVTILVLCGVIMFLIGILGEYIGKMYLILCNLPPYKVRTVIKGSVTSEIDKRMK